MPVVSYIVYGMHLSHQAVRLFVVVVRPFVQRFVIWLINTAKALRTAGRTTDNQPIERFFTFIFPGARDFVSFFLSVGWSCSVFRSLGAVVRHFVGLTLKCVRFTLFFLCDSIAAGSLFFFLYFRVCCESIRVCFRILIRVVHAR